MTDQTKPTPLTAEKWTANDMSLPAHHYVRIYTGDNEIRVMQDSRGKLYALPHNSRFGQIVRLVKSAPVLLAALKGLLDTADAVAFYDAPGRQESDDYEAAQEKARAAIRAAEGE